MFIHLSDGLADQTINSKGLDWILHLARPVNAGLEIRTLAAATGQVTCLGGME